MPPSSPFVSPLGVILHDADHGVEALLTRFAADLKALGVDVAGLCQRKIPSGRRKPLMELVNIRTEAVYPISQNLGSLSDSCVMDPAGMAEACAALSAEIERAPALLVVNKFGCLESLGGGLRAEMFEAVARGIPVLTSLDRRHRAQWDEMTGGAGTMLTADRAALEQWWKDVQGMKQ